MTDKNIKCIDCNNCDVEEMKCFPNSHDCEKEYCLTNQDLHTPSRCDFGEKK